MDAHENGQSEAFGTVLKQMREDRGLSQDDIAYAARQRAPTMTGGYVGRLERGEKRPSPATIAALAFGLGIDPGEFVEYRLALARRLFDERDPPQGVGLEQARDNVAVLEATLGSVADGLEDVVAEVATRLRERGVDLEELDRQELVRVLDRAARAPGSGSAASGGTSRARGKRAGAGRSSARGKR